MGYWAVYSHHERSVWIKVTQQDVRTLNVADNSGRGYSLVTMSIPQPRVWSLQSNFSDQKTMIAQSDSRPS